MHAIQNISLTVQTAGQGESTVKYTINLMDRPAQHERAAKDMIYKLDYFNDKLVKSSVTLEYAIECEHHGVRNELKPLSCYDDIIFYADIFNKIVGVNLHFMKEEWVSSNFLTRGFLVLFYGTYLQEDEPHGYTWVVSSNERYDTTWTSQCTISMVISNSVNLIGKWITIIIVVM